MNLFQVTWLSAILCTVLILIIFAYFWILSNFWKWNKYKIPYVPGLPILGNFKDAVLLKKSGVEVFQDLYNSACVKGHKFFGIYIFHNPAILIKDFNLIKKMFVTDFSDFSDRFADTSPKHDVYGSYTIFLLKNPLWKKVRSKLTPFFTTAQMRKMFVLIDDIASEFDKYFLKVVPANEEKVFEVTNLSLKYTTEVIASCAFGVRAFTVDNPNTVFADYGAKMSRFTFKRTFNFFTIFFLPKIAKVFKSKFFLEEGSNFICNLIKDTIRKREQSGLVRNDLIDILIQMKTEEIHNNVKNKIFTDNLLIAQSVSFFSGGSETTSTAMAFGLFEIAKYPEIQARLRQEIKDMLEKTKGVLLFDEINRMSYLGMVVKEIVRLYPTLPFLERRCGASNGYSMEPFDNLVIPYGMEVFVPLFALHRDPQYFEDPLKFDPERFAPERKTENIINGFLAFGIGPRNCIGERFVMTVLKTWLITVFKNHKIKLAEGQTPSPKLVAKSVLLAAVGGLNLSFSRDILYKM